MAGGARAAEGGGVTVKRTRLRSALRGWRVAVAAVMGSAAALGGAGMAGASGTTSTTAPLTLTQWKHSYEASIGKLADDALVVWSTGRKSAKHPTAKKITALIASCQQWHDDAETVPGGVPPIPQTSAERAWVGLIASSLSASADCLNALQEGAKSAEKSFDKKMLLVRDDEQTLDSALSGTGT